VTLTAWAKLSPSSNPPPSCMQGGTSPRTRIHLNSFNLVGQSPRWAACLSTGGASAPVWGMNEPEGLSTPLWCGQVHCPYGHEPMASWSGFRGVWGVDIHQKQGSEQPSPPPAATPPGCFASGGKGRSSQTTGEPGQPPQLNSFVFTNIATINV
jgi:hypothetical protein